MKVSGWVMHTPPVGLLSAENTYLFKWVAIEGTCICRRARFRDTCSFQGTVHVHVFKEFHQSYMYLSFL